MHKSLEQASEVALTLLLVSPLVILFMTFYAKMHLIGV